MARFRDCEEDTNALADHEQPAMVPAAAAGAGSSSNQTVGADDVDTTLGLSLSTAVPRNSDTALDHQEEDRHFPHHDHQTTAYDLDHAVSNPAVLDDVLDTTLRLSSSTSVSTNGGIPPLPVHNPTTVHQNEIGGLLLTTVSDRGGTQPVFLYRERLLYSDVGWRYCRRLLWVRKDEKLMEFLTVEEAAAAVAEDMGQGLMVVGVDGGGNVYENFEVIKSPVMDMTFIRSDWGRMVDANNAEEGDVVEIWGYRENGRPCFAVNFRREREIELG